MSIEKWWESTDYNESFTLYIGNKQYPDLIYSPGKVTFDNDIESFFWERENGERPEIFKLEADCFRGAMEEAESLFVDEILSESEWLRALMETFERSEVEE